MNLEEYLSRIMSMTEMDKKNGLFMAKMIIISSAYDENLSDEEYREVMKTLIKVITKGDSKNGF